MKKGLISNITDTLRESKKKQAPRKKKTNTFQVSSLFEYVDKMVKLKLPFSEKRKIGMEFLKKTGIDRKTLEKERNRHPYYKALKSRGHKERQRARNKFNKGLNDNQAKWEKEQLLEFLKLNPTLTDRQLAQHFKRSIPAVNAIRRRINLIKKTGNEKKMKKYIMFDERTLKKVLKQ